jgi:hypothetical protein
MLRPARAGTPGQLQRAGQVIANALESFQIE